MPQSQPATVRGGNVMGMRSGEVVHILSGFAKRALAATVTALCVHLLVMALDFYLVKKPLLSGGGIGFMNMAFSFPMLPIVVAYAVFSVLIYSAWTKMKESLVRTREKEIQEEKQRAAVESMRRMAGLLSEYITRHNNDIRMWLTKVKMRDGSVPVTVDRASRNISVALAVLTEMAFLEEPLDLRDLSMDDAVLFEKLMSEKMKKLSDPEWSVPR